MQARTELLKPHRVRAKTKDHHIPTVFRRSAKDLTQYVNKLAPVPVSRSKQTKAYTVCIAEIAKWVSLGTWLNLSEIPDEQRFQLLKACLSQMVMDGVVENVTIEMTNRRQRVVGALADKLNTLYRLNARSNKLYR